MEIYADNAATTRMSRRAINAMLPYMDDIYGNPSSIHSFGRQAKDALEEARQRVSAILGCSPREITFTSGGSESDNQAIRSAAAIGIRTGKRHIVSTAFEHHAVLHTLDSLKRDGFEITLIDVPENGLIDPEQIRESIRPDTCLVSVMYANNEIGTIQPAAEIGRICREKNVAFHTDAVQAFGYMPVRTDLLQADLLSLSAHKFHGPKGAGLLYCRRGISLAPVIYGGAQERGKRAGTENVPAIAGFAKAVELASADKKELREKFQNLKKKLVK